MCFILPNKHLLYLWYEISYSFQYKHVSDNSRGYFVGKAEVQYKENTIKSHVDERRIQIFEHCIDLGQGQLLK